VISPNILSVGDHKVEYIKHMLCTKTTDPSLLVRPNGFVNRVGRSPKLQSYFHYFNAKRYLTEAQCISVGGHTRNKTQYIQYRKCRSYLLYNIHLDSFVNVTCLTSNNLNIRVILILCIVLVLINAYCSLDKSF
jgi:hypothetical protein